MERKAPEVGRRTSTEEWQGRRQNEGGQIRFD